MTALIFLLPLLVPTVADTTDDRQAQLQSAVRAYVEPFDRSWDADRTRVAWVDLNGDRIEDAIVYLEDRDWCGSGGCTVLVFEAMDEIDAAEMGAFRPAAEISLMHGPIHVSRRRSNQWCELVVRDPDGTARVLRYDGETYPTSPTDAPRLRGRWPAGTTLFADSR